MTLTESALGDASELRPQELAMASSLVDSMTGDYTADEFADDYRDAVQTLIAGRLEGGEARPAPAVAAASTGNGQVVDLLAALQRSVEAAQGRGADAEPAQKPAAGKKAAAKAAARKTATKTAAKKAPAAKAATKKTATKAAAGRRSA